MQVADGRSGRWVALHGLLRPRQPDTIYRWLDRYEAEGIEGLTIREGRGRPPAYAPHTREAAKEEIEQVLHCSPRRFGIQRSRWRLQDIRQVISWLRECTLSGVGQILKRLGIRLKKAITYVHSPDPDYALKRWRVLRAFAAALYHPEQYIILFLDEFTFFSQPAPVDKYGASGDASPQVVRAAGPNHLTRIGAVLNGLTGCVGSSQGDKFGKVALEALYRQVRRWYPERTLFVVQDNCNFHESDNVLAAAAELDIHPVFLPTYTSWLNPIEKRWRWLNADVLHGHEFADDLQRLRQEVANFLDQFADGSSALLHYAGLLPD